MSRMLRLAVVVIVPIAMFVTAACRPNAVEIPPPRAVEPIAVEPTPTAELIPTPTAAASPPSAPTPVASPTPEPSPLPTVSPEEQVREVHERVMSELLAFDERDGDPIDLAAANTLLTGGLLDAVELLAERPSDGVVVTSDGFESVATSIEVSEDGRSAQLVDCSRELVEFWGADGTQLDGGDADWRTRTSQFALVGGQWQMLSFDVGGLCQWEQP